MDVISAILDIENTAKEMMRSAQQQRDDILAEAKENEQSIKDDISSEVSRALGKFEEQQKQEADAESRRISDETAETITRLDKAYGDEHEQWETQIFDRIIGKK